MENIIQKSKKLISEHRKGKMVGEEHPFYGKHHNKTTLQKYLKVDKAKVENQFYV